MNKTVRIKCMAKKLSTRVVHSSAQASAFPSKSFIAVCRRLKSACSASRAFMASCCLSDAARSSASRFRASVRTVSKSSVSIASRTRSSPINRFADEIVLLRSSFSRSNVAAAFFTRSRLATHLAKRAGVISPSSPADSA